MVRRFGQPAPQCPQKVLTNLKLPVPAFSRLLDVLTLTNEQTQLLAVASLSALVHPAAVFLSSARRIRCTILFPRVPFFHQKQRRACSCSASSSIPLTIWPPPSFD